MAALKEKNTNAARATKAGNKASKASASTSPNTSRKRKSNAESDKENNAPTTDADTPAKKRTKKSQDVEIAATPEPSSGQSKEDATTTPNPKPKTSTPAKKTSTTTSAKKTTTSTPKSTTKSKTSDAKPSKSSTPSTSSTKQKDSTDDYDVSAIHLDGESTMTVPVFDTCADIRQKINAHLRSKTIPREYSTQAALIRNFIDCLPSDVVPERVSTRSLTTYLKKKGPSDGISKPLHYAAYVYFEKLRLKMGKKKSKKRMEMEEHWGAKGMDVSSRNDSGGHFLMQKGDAVDITKYGRMTFVPGGRLR